MGPNGQVERREKLLLNLPEGAIIHTAKLDTPWTSETPWIEPFADGTLMGAVKMDTVWR